MAEKEDYESEWKGKYKVWEEKREEFRSASLQLEKVGQWRIDYFKNETEELSDKMQKTKTRDKAQKIEGDLLYKISEEAEHLSAGDIVDKRLEDIKKRVQAYKSSETGDQKEEGECNE